MPAALPATARRLLTEFTDLDVSSGEISEIIGRNPYLESVVMRVLAKRLAREEGPPSLRAAIPLLGMQATREFVLAFQLLRVVAGRKVPLDADGVADLKAADFVKFAARAQEFAQERRFDYPDLAFAAGMLFDLVLLVGRERFGAGPKLDEAVGQAFEHGLRAARAGVELAKTIPGFPYSKLVFAACLVHDIGKPTMELLHPPGPGSYAEFREATSKLDRCARHLLETERFGLTHDHYGALLVRRFGVLREAEAAVLFHHDPYLILRARPRVHPFAALVALSSNIAGAYLIPKDLNDPVFARWLTPEFKGFAVDRRLLLATMHKIGTDRF